MSSNGPLQLPWVGILGASTATSYVFFHNIGMSEFGIIPLLRGKLVPGLKLSAGDKARTWEAYYKTGSVHTVVPALVGALFNGYVAAVHPALGIRRLALGAAVLGASIVPYTLMWVMPINNHLKALSARAERGQPVDSETVDELVDDWKKLHTTRYISYFGAWALSLAAVALSGNVVVNVVDVVYNVTA